jgi:hypothetical protein
MGTAEARAACGEIVAGRGACCPGAVVVIGVAVAADAAGTGGRVEPAAG